MRFNKRWLQEIFGELVVIFDQVGLHTNVYKTKYGFCTPGFMWVGKGHTAHKKIDTGKETSYMDPEKGCTELSL